MELEIKVADHPNLVRRRGAIVNKDTEGFHRFQAARRAITDRDNRIEALEARLGRLEALLTQGETE